MKKLQTLVLALALVALGVFSGMSHAQRPSPKTSCEDDIKSGQLTITAPTASSITANSANLTGSVSVASILPGCTYTAKLVWGPVPTPPFPNTSATGSIPPSPLNLTGTASLLNPGSGYGARIEVTKQCLGLAPTVCNGPIRFFKTLPGEGHGKAKICVWKFEDKNENGKQEKGELALPGWKFEIKDGSGNPVATITTGGPTQTCADVPAPGTYTVTEVPVLSGWTPTTPNPQTVTVSPGQTVNLIFGNKKVSPPQPCSITISKKTNPSGGTGFSFSSAWAGLQGIALDDGKSISKPVPCGPIFNVFETPKPGWGLTNIACTFSSGTGSFKIIGASTGATNGFEPGDNEVNFSSLTPGASLQCTFTNTQPTTKLPDLIIKKRVSCSGPATAQGNKCTIAFTITNNGPGTFNGILTVQDSMTPSPAVAWAGGSTPTSTPQGWGWSCGLPLPLGCATTGPVTLAPPGNTTFSVDVYIPTGQYKNCATVKGYKQFPYSPSTLIQEGNSNNNEDCVGFVSSVPTCDREIKKTVTPNPVQSGQQVTVTLTVTNVGTAPCPVSAPGINVADPQPSGLTFQPPVSANKSGWSCGFSGPGVIAYCTSTSPLLPGAANAVTITFAAKVTASIQNCAEVTNVGDANQANNKSCVTVNVKNKINPPTGRNR